MTNTDPPTRAEAARDAAEGPLAPGTRVRIGRVDPYGYNGRDPHPPINRPDAEHDVPWSPMDGKLGSVVSYQGWEGESGACLRVQGSFQDEDGMIGEQDDREVFLSAGSVGDELPPTHYYSVVVDGFGVYELTDMEFAKEGTV